MDTATSLLNGPENNVPQLKPSKFSISSHLLWPIVLRKTKMDYNEVFLKGMDTATSLLNGPENNEMQLKTSEFPPILLPFLLWPIVNCLKRNWTIIEVFLSCVLSRL